MEVRRCGIGRVRTIIIVVIGVCRRKVVGVAGDAAAGQAGRACAAGRDTLARGEARSQVVVCTVVVVGEGRDRKRSLATERSLSRRRKRRRVLVRSHLELLLHVLRVDGLRLQARRLRGRRGGKDGAVAVRVQDGAVAMNGRRRRRRRNNRRGRRGHAARS
jgi:hypothetical protein